MFPFKFCVIEAKYRHFLVFSSFFMSSKGECISEYCTDYYENLTVSVKQFWLHT